MPHRSSAPATRARQPDAPRALSAPPAQPQWHATGLLLTLAVLTTGCLLSGPLMRLAGALEVVAPDHDEDEPLTATGVFLPRERLRERQFDQAQRLIAAGRMADATTLLDEMLAAEDDFFLEGEEADDQTFQSMKTRVNDLIGSLPPAGRDAYKLQFRSRADRALAAAVAADDQDDIVQVARRWFHTEAGQRAAIMTAEVLLEAGQPLAAAAWLDRIENSPHRLLPVAVADAVAFMRAAAELATADPAVRPDLSERITGLPKAGRLAAAPLPRGDAVSDHLLTTQLAAALAPQATPGANRPAAADWPLRRGSPSRNPVTSADRPLLVPRYRVPLTLHPEEQRLLAERREYFSEQDLPILPAGTPVAVGNTVVVHSRAGVVAIDFETGKRTWLQGQLTSSVIVDDDDDDEGREGLHPLDSLFRDTASTSLASDGQRVFVVESPRRSTSPLRQRNPAAAAPSANRLIAYDLEDGHVHWQLPHETEKPQDRWFLGSPLPLGNELYVLVEQRQQIRLDVLAADTGETVWSQPLAEVDIDHAIASRQERRFAGLSPAFAHGVLICPTGAGATIAVDATTRTLRWAYQFAIPKAATIHRLGNGMQVEMGVPRGRTGGGWLDSVPTIAGNHVLLTPVSSDDLHCLDLRNGVVQWKIPRNEHLTIAGVVGSRVLLLGQQAATAISIDDGQVLWGTQDGFDESRLCGRPLLTENRLFVPLTTPAVAEFDLATGRLVGSSPGRDQTLPGNLIAHRGEILSQGLDTLDAYHQTTVLEQAIETALQTKPDDPWAIGWRGHLRLAAGETTAGLNDLRSVFGPAGTQPAPAVVARAIRFALDHDFPAAADCWQEGVRLADSARLAAAIHQAAAAGSFAANKPAAAWAVCQNYLASVPPGQPAAIPEPLVPDRADPSLWLADSRWFQRQIHRLLDGPGQTGLTVPPAVREQVAEDLAATLTTAREQPTLAEQCAALRLAIDRVGNQPSAREAQESLLAALASLAAEQSGTAFQDRQLEHDLLDLQLRESPRAGLPLSSAAGQPSASVSETAWPPGRVEVSKQDVPAGNGDMFQTASPVSLTHTADSAFPGATLEARNDTLALRDRYGRPIGSPLVLDLPRQQGRQFLGGDPRLAATTAFLVSRVLLVQTTGSLLAYEIGEPVHGENRLLWTMVHPTADSPLRYTSRIREETDRLLRPLGLLRLGSQAGPQPLHQVLRTPDFRLGQPQLTGVPVIHGTTLELRDLQTGRILWRRRQIAAQAEAFGDRDLLCLITPEGSDSLVLSMTDGRQVAQHDLPPRPQRLAAVGRQLLVLADDVSDAEQLTLTTLDAANGETTPAGTCDRMARAVRTAHGLLMTVDPQGQLTTFDVAGSRVMFSTKLPAMVADLRQIACIPWNDRYLVFISRNETARDKQRFNGIGMIQPFSVRGEPRTIETGSLWALDRLTGDQLWSGPASVQRHVLHVPQPAGLPVMVFARRLHMDRSGQPGGRPVPDRPRQSLLCLDKRTGAMLHLDDKILLEPRESALAASLEIKGDPITASVHLQMRPRHQIGGTFPEVVLRFTDEPAVAAAPFRAEDHPLVYTDIASEFQFWLEKAIMLFE